MSAQNLDQLSSFCKSAGFVYPGSEIYGGFANSYTYGPLGVELKQNLKNLWWKMFVQQRADVVGIEGDIILHPKTWKASGHVDGFNDQMVDCKACHARHRADHLVEDNVSGLDCEGMDNEEVARIIAEHNITCPNCGAMDFTDVRQFNLMFNTQMAKTVTNDGDGSGRVAYLRPETAQAIFLEFKNVVDTQRVKVPFGIANMGKAFRNEITPGQFLFRRIEFEQMELQYFIHESDWKQFYDEWKTQQALWLEVIGLNTDTYRIYPHPEDKLAHYAKKAEDIEYKYCFGTKEVMGLHYRTDFDLKAHQEHSGTNLKYRDPSSGEKYIPHVIESTWGVDRNILAVLNEAYTEEKLEDDSTRIVLKLKPVLAPYKVAVLPLMKKDGMAEKAQEIVKSLGSLGYIAYDQGGSIGKRYRRQDEAGTPVCVTVDYETLKDNTVTVRDRDTMEQKRVAVEELSAYIFGTYYSS